MILGIGTDLTNISRIQTIINRYGKRFIKKIFSEREQQKASSRKNEAATLAKHWAAKEACSKALGIGLRMGISWKEMNITNLQSGKPILKIEGKAQFILKKIIPKGYKARIHVSLTDDYPWAKALVMIEAI